MAKKLNIPSIVGLNTESMPYSMIVFLQAMRDAMSVVDDNVIYRDVVKTVVPPSRIRAKSATGQTFTVSGTALASGDDHVVLVNDFQALLESHNSLVQTVDTLVKELRGE